MSGSPSSSEKISHFAGVKKRVGVLGRIVFQGLGAGTNNLQGVIFFTILAGRDHRTYRVFSRYLCGVFTVTAECFPGIRGGGLRNFSATGAGPDYPRNGLKNAISGPESRDCGGPEPRELSPAGKYYANSGA